MTPDEISMKKTINDAITSIHKDSITAIADLIETTKQAYIEIIKAKKGLNEAIKNKANITFEVEQKAGNIISKVDAEIYRLNKYKQIYNKKYEEVYPIFSTGDKVAIVAKKNILTIQKTINNLLAKLTEEKEEATEILKQIQQSSKQSKYFTMFGGSYNNKYMKYKSKYLKLKQLLV